MMVIHQVIKGLRKEKELSQKDLSEALGITNEDVSRIEGGKRKTYPIDLLVKISEFFDVSIDYLCKGEGLKYIITQDDIDFYEIYKKEKSLSESIDPEMRAADRRMKEIRLMKMYENLAKAVQEAQDAGIIPQSDE